MFDRDDNLVQSFQLESSHLRGRLVRLGAALDLILHQHAYPEPVARLLAEAMTIAAALASSLNYDGVFTLQAKGDGPVRLLVADVMSGGGIRAYAQYDKDVLGKNAGKPESAGVADTTLLGKGYMAFTCSLKNKDDRYQGIVALEGGTLAEAVQHYFRQSEQLSTGIVAAARRDAQGRWRGGCLLLQKMPRDGGILREPGSPLLHMDVESASPEAEDWTRAMLVMGTCTPQELTDADIVADALLFRLFHEEGVRVYEPLRLRHECRCSQARVEGMLRALPRTEIEELAENGRVTVTCEFCNKSYGFSEAEIEALYAPTPSGPTD
jgi:molecular chaperone Hsp33